MTAPAPPRRRLASRFLAAGALFVLATVACGVWSIYTFRRLSGAVDRTLRDSQAEIDLASALASQLEREDDALLLYIANRTAEAGAGLAAGRPQVDATYQRLRDQLVGRAEQVRADQLRDRIADYRRAGDAVMQTTDTAAALVEYHRAVNPHLREAVAACDAIREHNFLAMKAAGVRARDEAGRAVGVVAIVLAGALLMSIVVALLLARAVVRPITTTTASIDALRRGELGVRLPVDRTDELGILADGFNRMAASLEEFRSSNLGEVMRAKAILETTLETLPDGVVVVAHDGRVEAMNQRARDILGSGDRVDRLPMADRLQEELAAARGPEPGSRRDLERTIAVDVAGLPRKLLPIAAPFRGVDGTGAVIVLYDVTDLARLDELRSEVVAVASHELRTPLTTIRMSLMMLREGLEQITPRQREMLDNAVGGCDELMGMTDRLIDMARIEAGQLRLNREPIDVAAVVDQIVDRVRERATGAEIELAVERDSSRTRASVDVPRIQAAIANVIHNAIKYSPQRAGVRIQIHGDNGVVRVTVTDAGPGVPPTLRDRVFDKFFRVEHLDPDRDRGVRGVGLGLYLTRQIVVAHGGSVRLDAGPGGVGTQVTLEVPSLPT